LGLNIRFKGYVYRQHLYTVRQGNGTTLPPEVFTLRNFVADFMRLNLDFIHKNDKFASSYGADFISRYWSNLVFFRGVSL